MAPTQLNPYISFKDNARQAMEFYQSIFGGKVEIHDFKEYHASSDPSEDSKVMHSMLTADNGMIFMAADTPNAMDYKPGASITMSISGENDEELSAFFNKLADGGTITMPLEKAPWGDKFGMVADKFGVNWMVNIHGGQSMQPQA